MRKRGRFILISLFVLLTNSLLADNKIESTSISANSKSASRNEVNRLTGRIFDIKKEVLAKTLTANEKSAYRREVIDIQKRIKMLNGVSIYLSGLAIVIIVLLIILL